MGDSSSATGFCVTVSSVVVASSSSSVFSSLPLSCSGGGVNGGGGGGFSTTTLLAFLLAAAVFPPFFPPLLTGVFAVTGGVGTTTVDVSCFWTFVDPVTGGGGAVVVVTVSVSLPFSGCVEMGDGSPAPDRAASICDSASWKWARFLILSLTNFSLSLDSRYGNRSSILMLALNRERGVSAKDCPGII